MERFLTLRVSKIFNGIVMKNKGTIGVTTQDIFPIIKKFLYSDHEIFLRELISNAVDATQKVKALSAKGDIKGELGDLTVRVSADPAKKTITVSDRGIGMTDHPTLWPGILFQFYGSQKSGDHHKKLAGRGSGCQVDL
jgi:hypothetical protein